jgi:hypothetical protein
LRMLLNPHSLMFYPTAQPGLVLQFIKIINRE